MSSFLHLLRKDLEAIRWSAGIISGVTIGLMVFLRYRLATGWPQDLVSVLMILPLMFLPFWLLWQSFQGLRTEWRENTIYTLLCLPVPGWQIILAKLSTVMVEYTLLLTVIAAGNFAFNPLVQGFMASIPTLWLVRNGILLYLGGLFSVAFFVVFIQLAFVVSKMVGRLQALVALWALFLAFWLAGKLGWLLEPLFRWIPPIPLHRVFRLDEIGRNSTSYWHIGFNTGKWLTALALFWLTGYLLENYVEAN